NALCRLAACIQFPVPGWILVRRVENRMLEKAIFHRSLLVPLELKLASPYLRVKALGKFIFLKANTSVRRKDSCLSGFPDLESDGSISNSGMGTDRRVGWEGRPDVLPGRLARVGRRARRKKKGGADLAGSAECCCWLVVMRRRVSSQPSGAAWLAVSDFVSSRGGPFLSPRTPASLAS